MVKKEHIRQALRTLDHTIVLDFLLWRTSVNNSFKEQLFNLIAKADLNNRAKISEGFPQQLFIFNLWESFESEKEFLELCDKVIKGK